MAGAATRWGIVSAGAISNDFVCALGLITSGKHKVVAIAARDAERAASFAEYHNITRSYGSYAQLAEDPDIDVVYIGSLHLTHHEIVKLMLNAGKAVLCEKPLTLNLRQNQDLIDCARRKGVLLVEGFWTRMFPAYKLMMEEISRGTIGEPRIINFIFGYDGGNDPYDWRYDVKTGGGMTLLLACYGVSLADSVFQKKPEKVVANGSLTDKGADMTTNITLNYGNNRMAVITVTRACILSNTALIHGTRGMIELPKPWCPVEVTIRGRRSRFPVAPPPEKMISSNRPGFVYEAEHMRELLLNGERESPLITLDSSLRIMEILDQARLQLGVIYEADSQEY